MSAFSSSFLISLHGFPSFAVCFPAFALRKYGLASVMNVSAHIIIVPGGLVSPLRLCSSLRESPVCPHHGHLTEVVPLSQFYQHLSLFCFKPFVWLVICICLTDIPSIQPGVSPAVFIVCLQLRFPSNCFSLLTFRGLLFLYHHASLTAKANSCFGDVSYCHGYSGSE